mgnify:CR=1 FL=1
MRLAHAAVEKNIKIAVENSSYFGYVGNEKTIGFSGGI